MEINIIKELSPCTAIVAPPFPEIGFLYTALGVLELAL